MYICIYIFESVFCEQVQMTNYINDVSKKQHQNLNT